MERKPISDAEPGRDVEPLVADLRLIEACPRRSAKDQERLVPLLQVLPTLVIVRAYAPPGREDEMRSVCLGLDNTFQQVLDHLMNDNDKNAARYLLRLTKESAHATADDLYKAAARCYPGRNRGSGDERMKSESFTRRNGPHDRLIALIAEILQDLEAAAEQAPEKAVTDSISVATVPGTQPKVSGFKHEYVVLSSLCHFDAGRHPSELLVFRLIRALEDDIDYVRTNFPPSRGAYEVFGGDVEFAPRGGGYTNARIFLGSPPLRAGETRSIHSRSRYLPTDKPVTYRKWAPGGVKAELVAMAVQFSVAELPARVWWFENVLSSHVPPLFEKTHLLLPNSVGYVERQFHSPNPRKACGIAWEWE